MVALAVMAMMASRALDVIVVTKEGTASLHGLEERSGGGGGGDNKAAPKKTAAVSGVVPGTSAAAKSPNGAQRTADDDDDDDDDDLTSEEDDSSEDSSDDDDGDEDDDVVEVDAEGTTTLGRGATNGTKKAAAAAAAAEQGKKGIAAQGQKSGSGGNAAAGRRKGGGRGKGNQRLFDWQVRGPASRVFSRGVSSLVLEKWSGDSVQLFRLLCCGIVGRWKLAGSRRPGPKGGNVPRRAAQVAVAVAVAVAVMPDCFPGISCHRQAAEKRDMHARCVQCSPPPPPHCPPKPHPRASCARSFCVLYVRAQAVRYGLAEGAAQAILLVSRHQYRWIVSTAPRSPISSGGVGSKRRGGACPVLLSADGRVVTAVDAGTGDRAVLVTGVAPVRAMAVGGNGETVRYVLLLLLLLLLLSLVVSCCFLLSFSCGVLLLLLLFFLYVELGLEGRGARSAPGFPTDVQRARCFVRVRALLPLSRPRRHLWLFHKIFLFLHMATYRSASSSRQKNLVTKCTHTCCSPLLSRVWRIVPIPPPPPVDEFSLLRGTWMEA